MTAHDYLVEMTFAPFGSLPSPQEVVTFSEHFVLPTLESCQKLQAAGRIVAGGTALAAVGFTFIARVDSPQELEEMIAGLPLWTRAQTRVVPLGTFESRTTAVRQRLARAKVRTSEAAAVSQNGGSVS